jgi:hypothetical protein
METRGVSGFYPQPKARPRIFDRLEDRVLAERRKRQVYAEVDARDMHRCRCCGRRGSPYATDPLGRIHRAHILDASRGGALVAWNLASLCWICHALEHAKQLHFIGQNANSHRLRFELHEAAVVEVFGARELPAHVRIITSAREARG